MPASRWYFTTIYRWTDIMHQDTPRVFPTPELDDQNGHFSLALNEFLDLVLMLEWTKTSEDAKEWYVCLICGIYVNLGELEVNFSWLNRASPKFTITWNLRM